MDGFDVIVELIFNKDYKAIFSLVILNSLRPLGLLYGFVMFNFALGPSRMLRVSIAVAISIPMWIANSTQITTIINDPQVLKLVAAIPKEMLIGYGLGLLASLPFWSFQYAGSIIDQFRGESDSGIQDDNNLPISTIGLLYLILISAIFVYSDGISLLVAFTYQSYVIWPLDAVMPSFAGQAPDVILSIFTEMLKLCLWISFPILFILVLIEFLCYGAARIATRYNFYGNAFAIKNLITVITLPLGAAFILSLDIEDLNHSGSALNALEHVLK